MKKIPAPVLFDIFEAPRPSWVDLGSPPESDNPPESSYMGGVYAGEELDHEYLAWHKSELVAVVAYLNTTLPRSGQFGNMISNLCSELGAVGDFQLLHFHFERWRVSKRADGSSDYEVFDGVHYLAWHYSPNNLLIGFEFEDWLLLAANCRPFSDGSSFSDLVRDGVLPWRANRFPGTERNPQHENKIVNFAEGSFSCKIWVK